MLRRAVSVPTANIGNSMLVSSSSFCNVLVARRASSTTTTVTITIKSDERSPSVLINGANSSSGVTAVQGTQTPTTNYFQNVNLIPQNRWAGMPAISAFNFDWDDNIFFMDTKLVLIPVDQSKMQQRSVSTNDFAKIRQDLGKRGEWKDYKVTDETFKYFGDSDPNRNFFLESIERTIADATAGNKKSSWRGPCWDAFAHATSTPERARATTIITAREHSPFTMAEGLLWLKHQGYIQHVPPWYNLYAVSYGPLRTVLGGGGGAANPSEAKVAVMKKMLDNIEANPVHPQSRLIDAPEGGGKQGRYHRWGFSDDDEGNYKTALEALAPEVAAGRWPNVKLTLFFSSAGKAVVIKPDGSTRPVNNNEAVWTKST